MTYTNSGTTEPIGSLTNVTLGSVDSDSFQYDVNTGRPTQYKFKVGTSQSNTGTLGWNPNGTLASLGITDQINTSNSQNCTYTYDDLARLASANCTNNAWSQSFNYDAFGNVTKTGSISWACATCYDTSTNRYNHTLSGQISYDSDGNLTNDTFTVSAGMPTGT